MIPERKVLPPVVQVPVLPEESPVVTPVKVDNNPKTDEGKYKLAISFGLEEVENKNEGDKPNEQSKIEYSEPNELRLDAGTVIPVRLLTGIDTSVE